ncbi:transglycosylase SLT domain-containing protein [Halomonas saccharevitans]|uniref:Membrane-bound lytic murein transglycosylase D n=1 Tax=Halomonas saccharevitans TaxID=416872 RepID=A0A1I7A134_9GAMM|nr:transglycosylase SLT domain-containing protein [Halomonas saccharevitans]SFT68597.1 membrane-bound lytic murein transglycosylase D [Halomonas saccharevitans]
MTYHTSRRRILGFTSCLALMGSLMVAGNSHASTTSPGSAFKEDSASQKARPAPLPSSLHFWDALALEPQDAWSRLSEAFQWQADADHPRVQHWIEHYRQSPHNIAQITERARPWLAWITERVEERGLPGEIALIPFIESSFDPTARSHMGATGLWQFMPGTGNALGLHRGGGYDGRLDVARSTHAALDYIEMQAEQWYEGDIELSLAAYNAGAGNVNRARSAALARGQAGSYWDLDLPGETMAYVPKLIAISTIIADPEGYGVALPEIEAEPAVAEVPVTRSLMLNEAAQLAGVSRTELEELNPGLLGNRADPRRVTRLLVPAESATRMVARLRSDTPDRATIGHDEVYVVRRGDSLSAIASRHSVTLAELARWNGIERPDALQPGQQLTLSGS